MVQNSLGVDFLWFLSGFLSVFKNSVKNTAPLIMPRFIEKPQKCCFFSIIKLFASVGEYSIDNLLAARM
jgi:hypothetical protein